MAICSGVLVSDPSQSLEISRGLSRYIEGFFSAKVEFSSNLLFLFTSKKSLLQLNIALDFDFFFIKYHNSVTKENIPTKERGIPRASPNFNEELIPVSFLRYPSREMELAVEGVEEVVVELMLDADGDVAEDVSAEEEDTELVIK